MIQSIASQGMSVEIILGYHSHLDRRWNNRTTNESYVRLYLVLSGQGWMEHHGKSFDLVPGNMYIIPPGSNLSFRCDDQVEILWYHAVVKRADGINLFDLVDCEYERTPDDFAMMVDYVHRILELGDDSSPGAALTVHALVLLTLAPFLRSVVTEDGEIDELRTRFIPVLEMIHHQLSPPALDDLAALVGQGRNHFIRLFKKAFGMPPLQYYQRHRIGRAQLLLVNSQHKIETIAEKLGFHDAFHFSRAFKKITGLSPAHYRRQAMDVSGP